MRYVRRAFAKGVEVCAPVGAHSPRIREIDLVLLLDERGVAAEERACSFVLLHHAHGCCLMLNFGFAADPLSVDAAKPPQSHSFQRSASGFASRRLAPVKSWRGRPIFCSGSEIISFHCAIQPTVRASTKMAVNRLTGMPIARCTM